MAHTATVPAPYAERLRREKCGCILDRWSNVKAGRCRRHQTTPLQSDTVTYERKVCGCLVYLPSRSTSEFCPQHCLKFFAAFLAARGG